VSEKEKNIDYFEIVNSIQNVESKNKLFDRSILGVSYWQLIRLDCLNVILENNSIKEAQPVTRSSMYNASKVWNLLLSISHVVMMVFTRSNDFLFLGHSRRNKLVKGVNEDIYCDEVIIALREKYRVVSFERPFKGGHCKRNASNRVLFLDLLALTQIVFCRLMSPIISYFLREKIAAESRIVMQLHTVLTFSQVKRMILAAVIRHKVGVFFYKSLISLSGCKVAVVVCSYGHLDFVSACKAKKIKCVELQHGTSISRLHLGYNLPENSGIIFPDYFFSFGDFWAKTSVLPIKPEAIISVGFPFLEKNISVISSKTKKIDYLFISQPVLTKRLLGAAIKLASEFPASRVAYKLHPAENEDLVNRIIFESGSELEVVPGSADLYSTLATARIVVGVYSTALYEAVEIGCDVRILDFPGAEFMSGMIKEKKVKLNKLIDLMDESLDFKDGNYRMNNLFRRNSLQNIQVELSRLISL
jgi:hypothetical protein